MNPPGRAALCGGCFFTVLAFCQPALHLKIPSPEAPVLGAAYARSARWSAGARTHLVVQFAEPPGPAQIRLLEERGARVLEYVPDHGFLISAPEEFEASDLPLVFAGSLRENQKLSQSVDGETGEGHFVVEFHRDVDPAEGRRIALASRLEIVEHADLLERHLLVKGSLEALHQLAAADEVAYIFPASPDLIERRAVHACANASTTNGPIGQYTARAGDGWDGPGLNAAALKYALTTLTQKLTSDSIRSEFARAFAEWARHAKLTFTPSEVSDAPRTIAVLFASGAHGDPYPFDGPGKTLAHTFYPSPPNPENLAGDIHFDDDESWTIGGRLDLFSVALHEIGHALGLGHSDVPGAVMYPYYQQLTRLTAEDVKTLLALYAAQDAADPGSPSPSPQPPNPPPSPAPPLPLTLVIERPGATATTSDATVALSGTVTGGDGEVEVSWLSDRGYSGRAAGSRSWVIPSVPLSPGPNVIIVSAVDAARTRASQTVLVTRQVTTVPVHLRILSPAADGTYTTTAETITVSGEAVPADQVARVAWSDGRGNSGRAKGTASWTAGPIPLAPGANTIKLTAVGLSGSLDSQALIVVRQVDAGDKVPPVLQITSPPSTSVSTSASTITLRGTARDNTGVAEVSWTSSTGAAGIATGTENWVAADVPLLVGANTLIVRARDAAGNTAWRSLVVTRR